MFLSFVTVLRISSLVIGAQYILSLTELER